MSFLDMLKNLSGVNTLSAYDDLQIPKDRENELKLEAFRAHLIYEKYSDAFKHLSKFKSTDIEKVILGKLFEEICAKSRQE